MSHFPPSTEGQNLVEALSVEDPTYPPQLRCLGAPYRVVNTELLREVLIALTCPAPCVGYVNDVGWHQLCEDRVDSALKILALYSPLASQAEVEAETEGVHGPDDL